jgi:hypothetical protein
VQQVGIIGNVLEPENEMLGRHREVPLRHGEIPDREIALFGRDFGLDRRLEQSVQNQLGIGTQSQRRLAQRDDVGRVPIGPGPRTGQAVDLQDRLLRLVRLSVEEKHVPRQQTQSDAGAQRIPAKSRRDHFQRLAVFAGQHLEPQLEKRPFLIRRVLLQRRFGGSQSLGILARVEKRAAPGDIRNGGDGAGEGQQTKKKGQRSGKESQPLPASPEGALMRWNSHKLSAPMGG